jgi:hypothetical protein
MYREASTDAPVAVGVFQPPERNRPMLCFYSLKNHRYICTRCFATTAAAAAFTANNSCGKCSLYLDIYKQNKH